MLILYTIPKQKLRILCLFGTFYIAFCAFYFTNRTQFYITYTININFPWHLQGIWTGKQETKRNISLLSSFCCAILHITSELPCSYTDPICNILQLLQRCGI